MEITATIASVLPMVTGVSAKGEWKKATIIVKWMDGSYEQYLALDNLRNADAFAMLQVGQTMTFHINVTSRENNGKWYTSATCWKWDALAQQPVQPMQPMQQAAPQVAPQQFTYPQQPYNIPGQSANTADMPF